ncbi:hypothetical protein QUF76_17425, partial [Desulfobacterales bacterium HSG16]|nr:hypothetical protein [Desulfobacterales bacterium HSG16]
QIKDYIKKYFFYVEYPESLKENFWKDEGGRLQSILVMNPEDLKRCIARIETDIYRFDGVLLNDIQQEAMDAILPVAQKIKSELKNELSYHQKTAKEDAMHRVSDLRKSEDAAELYASKLALQIELADEKREILFQARLPRWMVDQLKSEGELSETLAKYLLKAGFNEDSLDVDDEETLSEETDSFEISEDDFILPKIKKEEIQLLNSSLKAILGFVNMAMAPYDWPEETMVKYLKSIKRIVKRIQHEIASEFASYIENDDTSVPDDETGSK